MQRGFAMTISRTARDHEVCTTSKYGYDGCRRGKDWEQCWVLPERVYWTPINGCSPRRRINATVKMIRMGEGSMHVGDAPVGISSSEPFPTLNQSGSPSPER